MIEPVDPANLDSEPVECARARGVGSFVPSFRSRRLRGLSWTRPFLGVCATPACDAWVRSGTPWRATSRLTLHVRRAAKIAYQARDVDGDSTRRNETPFSARSAVAAAWERRGESFYQVVAFNIPPMGCSTAARSRRIGGCGQVMTLASEVLSRRGVRRWIFFAARSSTSAWATFERASLRVPFALAAAWPTGS